MKKVIFGILTILVVILMAIRIEKVNENIPYPEIKEYKMQEEVPIGKNIFTDDYENMDGYSIVVKEAEIFTYDEFLEKFQYNEETQEKLFQGDEITYPEMVCNVRIVVKNRNEKDDPDKGIDFRNYALYGEDFQLQLNELLYAVANPDMEDRQMSFRLRPETEKEFSLPFYFSPSGKVEPIQVEEVINGKLYLPISFHPEHRQIILGEIKH